MLGVAALALPARAAPRPGTPPGDPRAGRGAPVRCPEPRSTTRARSHSRASSGSRWWVAGSCTSSRVPAGASASADRERSSSPTCCSPTISIGWASDTDVTGAALRTLAQLFLLYVMAANVLDDWSRIARVAGRPAPRHHGARPHGPRRGRERRRSRRAAVRRSTRSTRTSWQRSWPCPRCRRSPSARDRSRSAGGACWRWSPSSSRWSRRALAAERWHSGRGSPTLAIGRPRLGTRGLAAVAVVGLLLPVVLPDNTLQLLRHRWEKTRERPPRGPARHLARRPGDGRRQAAAGHGLRRLPRRVLRVHARRRPSTRGSRSCTAAATGSPTTSTSARSPSSASWAATLFGLALAAHTRTAWRLQRAAMQVGDDEAEDVALALLAGTGHAAGGGSLHRAPALQDALALPGGDPGRGDRRRLGARMSRAAVAAFPRSVRGNPYCDLLYGSLAARGVAIAAARRAVASVAPAPRARGQGPPPALAGVLLPLAAAGRRRAA